MTVDSLHVARLRARYRLPAGEPDARNRLDGLLREVLDEALEHALDRAGVAAHEEVCVRTVDAPVRLSLGAPDSALVAAWSVALAGAIRATLDAGGPDVVRYRSRSHALSDLLAGVARGDLSRAWAWRQLGLWSAGDAASAEGAADEAARALAARPEAVVAALSAAARNGILPALAARIRPAAWAAVARAALEAASVPDSAIPLLLAAPGRSGIPDPASPGADATPPAGAPAPDGSLPAAAAAARRVRRAVEQSAVARALCSRPGLAPETRSALAIVAILEAEPSALIWASSESAVLVAAVECEVFAGPPSFAPHGPGAEPAASTPNRNGTGSAAAPGRTQVTATPHDALRDSLTEPATAPSGRRESLFEQGDGPIGDGADDGAPLDARSVGRTRRGGLLFLLHVVDELEVPQEVVESPVFSGRTLRWVLHRLALSLLALDERDPAALAFAGLAPDADPPSRGEEPASDGEIAGVEGIARRVEARLFERLRGAPAPDARAAAALLRETTLREATIEADPGWIDVRLSLDEVSVEVRRAGLDLDPGWVPWLGAAVRFVYA